MYHRLPQRQHLPTILTRDAIREWMRPMHFTHFITLASNNQMASRGYMKKRLREWDARVNRELLGPKWHKKIDERMHWIAFPEKEGINPHWHLLMQLLPEQIEAFGDRCKIEGRSFEDVLINQWRCLVKSGSCDAQMIIDSPKSKARVYDYVTKSLGNGDNLENFVMYREYFEL